ncbi:MAG: hypothetical protein NZ750_02735 [Anaerolineae bacterium]|nr:hypothetical protein [Anaerolineae bacterium]MDW8173404.1 hypothetical protein [Anaerolineae bacterium]
MKLVLLGHTASTLYMMGAIWVIQAVHYNLFNLVGREAFPSYHSAHVTMITPIVGLPMLLEALTAFLLLIDPPPGVPSLLLLIGLGLVGLVWLMTMMVQVPLHNALAFGFDQARYEALVASNWVRTIAWTLRGLLALVILAYSLKDEAG